MQNWIDQHDAAFVDGHHEPYTNFDFASLDRTAESEPPQSAIDARAAEAFKRILMWCWAHPRFGHTTAFRRFALLTLAISPELVNAKTSAELAAKLDVTKQSLSRHLRNLSREFNVHLNQRTDTARQHMREAAFASLERRKAEKNLNEAPAETVA